MAKKEIELNIWQKSGQKVKSFWNWLRADRKRIIAASAILILLVSSIWYLVSKSAKGKTTYQTSTVQKGTVVSTISASGHALSTSVLPISTQASGIVKNVYVKDGDKIVKGQRIADITLDTTGEQQYLQALSSYYSAKSGLVSANNAYYNLQAAEYAANVKFMNDAVARNLDVTDPTYIQEYDAWKASEASFLNQPTTLAQANASLNNAAINLQLSSPTITAPYTGTVSNINLVSGMVITNTSSTSSSGTSTVSSQRVAVIKNEATPIVNVTLGETDVPNVKVGQKATITFDSITDKTFTGVVATVDRIGTISSNVTSYGVNIKLDSGSNLILPNMAATADIITDTATDVLFVPSAALITQNGTIYAKTLVNGKEIDAPVETGISSDTDTVITSGLTEGETVITGTASTTTSTSGSTGTSVFSRSFGGGGGAVIRTGGGAATGR
ncbi:MAG: efflux RND transporter periplasmic adaptor subunit [Candidatus Woesebacteria bacterium]|nr:efflux RND transporter periplasmic adaptor subunit [Candidatus Woesebacteria bacterium]